MPNLPNLKMTAKRKVRRACPSLRPRLPNLPNLPNLYAQVYARAHTRKERKATEVRQVRQTPKKAGRYLMERLPNLNRPRFGKVRQSQTLRKRRALSRA